MGSCEMIIKKMFELERRSGRVVMGYLLGFAVLGFWMRGFLQFAAEIGEPVNILETFCVVEQHHVNLLFLILGWLLVTADAPFMKGNLYLLLYRCGRRCWNRAMLFYILIHAFVYTASMAAFTVIISSFSGFAGNMWSSPLYLLAQDTGNHIGVKYNISFPWAGMVEAMTVPQAFAVTCLFLFMYLLFLGVLLYTVSLLASRTAGMAAVIGVHLLGYLRMMEGSADSSLLARAVPGNFIDGTLRYWFSAGWFLALTAVLMILSAVFVKGVEFHLETEADE